MSQEIRDIISQIQDMADVTEDQIVFHDESLTQVQFHRGKIEAYLETIKLLDEAMKKGVKIEV